MSDDKLPFPPHNRTPTSIEAAASIANDTSRLRQRIYRLLEERGVEGATREEIADALGLSGSTVRPRVWELLGNPAANNKPMPTLIFETAHRRRTRSGRRAAVLVTKEYADV